LKVGFVPDTLRRFEREPVSRVCFMFWLK